MFSFEENPIIQNIQFSIINIKEAKLYDFHHENVSMPNHDVFLW